MLTISESNELEDLHVIAKNIIAYDDREFDTGSIWILRRIGCLARKRDETYLSSVIKLGESYGI